MATDVSLSPRREHDWRCDRRGNRVSEVNRFVDHFLSRTKNVPPTWPPWARGKVTRFSPRDHNSSPPVHAAFASSPWGVPFWLFRGVASKPPWETDSCGKTRLNRISAANSACMLLSVPYLGIPENSVEVEGRRSADGAMQINYLALTNRNIERCKPHLAALG